MQNVTDGERMGDGNCTWPTAGHEAVLDPLAGGF
jgi:hypothetical protein